MSELSKTYGTKAYGPFKDGSVQTYFRFSPEHRGHIDLQLATPSPVRDTVEKIGHIPVRTK